MDHIQNGPVLERDIEALQAALIESQGDYCFSEDLRERSSRAGLSSKKLGEHLKKSHTTVDNWKHGTTIPYGRELFKQIGLAFNMEECELSNFLRTNGYPGLFPQNPLDDIALLVIKYVHNAPKNADVYRKMAAGINHNEPGMAVRETVRGHTVTLTAELHAALDAGLDEALAWIRAHEHLFPTSGAVFLPNIRTARFLVRYLYAVAMRERDMSEEFGETDIRAATVNALGMPNPLKEAMYAVLSGEVRAVRFLREKIVGIGLFFNMRVEEIDAMLDYLHMPKLTDQSTREQTEQVVLLDKAILQALNMGHMRRVLYCYENAVAMCASMQHPADEEERCWLEIYQVWRTDLEEEAGSYRERVERDDWEIMPFEERYSSYVDRGLMDYVRDLLQALLERGNLPETETENFIHIISRPEE